jgi:hypothetical protein
MSNLRGLSGDISTALISATGTAPSAVKTGVSVGQTAGGPIGALVGLGVFGIGALIGGLFGTSKVGQEKRTATSIVNQAAVLMQANLQAYQASGHTRAEQAQAEATFIQIWNQQVQALSDPSVADVKDTSISERARGGKYDNWRDNYDPIANDPAVQDSTAALLTSNSGLLWLGVGIMILGIVL